MIQLHYYSFSFLFFSAFRLQEEDTEYEDEPTEKDLEEKSQDAYGMVYLM